MSAVALAIAPEVLDRMRRLRDNGRTVRSIAAELRLSAGTVQRRLAGYRAPPRPLEPSYLHGACRHCGAPLRPRRCSTVAPHTYCSKRCLCTANSLAIAAARPWPDADILTALHRYVAEFGPLQGAGRYDRSIAGRTDYPSADRLEARFGSVLKAGLAAGVATDPYRRDWTPDELARLESLRGHVPTVDQLAGNLGRTRQAVVYQLNRQRFNVRLGFTGCVTAREMGRWLHYGDGTIGDAIRRKVLVAHKLAGQWQIRPGALLAAEGILYRDRADLDEDVRFAIESDRLDGDARSRVEAWQVYREPGRLYPWRHGEIAAWWRAWRREHHG